MKSYRAKELMQEPAKRFTYRMKKLFLTSFEFQTGENTYKEQRLVMVDSLGVLEGEDYLKVAYEKAINWFHGNYPESKMLACIAHDTITGYPDDEVRGEKAVHGHTIGFDASWHNGTDHPKSNGNSAYSISVLIDMYGTRRFFTVGWYDFDHKKWIHDGNDVLDSNELVWQNLPFTD